MRTVVAAVANEARIARRGSVEIGRERAAGAHRHDAAQRGTAVERRGGAAQDLHAPDEGRVDEVPRRMRETADGELLGYRHAVDLQRDPVAADAAYGYAFGTEARTRALVADARHEAEHVGERGGQRLLEVLSGDRRDVRRDVAQRRAVFRSDHHDLLERRGVDPGSIGGLRSLRRAG